MKQAQPPVTRRLGICWWFSLQPYRRYSVVNLRMEGASGEPRFLGVLFDQPVVTGVNLTVGSNALFNFDGTTFPVIWAGNLCHAVRRSWTDRRNKPSPKRFHEVIFGKEAL